MSEPFAGFVGLSYQSLNKYAAIERTSNWLLGVNESVDTAKGKFELLPCPCNAAFGQLPVPPPLNQRSRFLLEYRGQVFGMNGDAIFYIDPAGVYHQIGGSTGDFGGPVSMVGNGNDQIFVSAGTGWVINVAYPGQNSTLSGIGLGAFFGASYATFQDGYVIVITPGTNQFQISGTDATPIGDMRLWSAANVSIQAGQQDKLVACISSREYLRLLGARRSQIYQNVGNAGIGGFPFQSYNETFIETGCAAPFSLVDLGDSLMWIGEDARGQRACWRDAAFQPQRASTFAVEQFWQQYPTVADCVAFPYIWMGHLLAQFTFPTARRTWLYDATVSQLLQRPCWVERAFLDTNGNEVERPEQFHCYAYGKHLVASAGADGNPGAIYQYAQAPWTDCAQNVAGAQVQQATIRDRICPHIWHGNKRVIYNRIEFELARGVGLSGSPPVGVDPVILLRWSNDGGNTFGPEQQIKAGRIGEFFERVYYNRAGYGRDRVFWVRCTDPVFWGFVAAELDLTECAS